MTSKINIPLFFFSKLLLLASPFIQKKKNRVMRNNANILHNNSRISEKNDKLSSAMKV